MIFFIVYAIAFTSAAPQKNVDSVERVQKPLFYSINEAPALFENFIKEYNKKYDIEEKEEKFKIFVNNLKEINSLNEKSSKAVFSVNKFSDLSEEEFRKFYTGFKPEKGLWNRNYKEHEVLVSFNVTAPDAFDWRNRGVVSRVKEQKRCGACWAFSTTGNVESLNAIKTNNMVELSEQQLVDCDTSSNGCTSGYLERAQGYLVSNGAMSGNSYPYIAAQGTCKYDSSKVVVRLRSYEKLSLSEDQMKDKLYSTAPLSIAVVSKDLSSYNGGILIETCSKNPKVDHAVLLVGYGNEGGTDFWIIKNSWGSNWGENGYFRMKRGINCLQVTQNGIVSGIL